VLTGPQEPIAEMYDQFETRRDYVTDRLDEMDGLEEGLDRLEAAL